MFPTIPYQEQIEVKRSDLCWISILFDFLRLRSLIFYILYILLMLFIDINTSLENSWTPIVAYKNSEGKNPENSYFHFFVMTPLWCKVLKLFWSVLSMNVWSPLHILVKNSSSSKLKFIYFSFYFFYFLYFWKTADVSIFLYF